MVKIRLTGSVMIGGVGKKPGDIVEVKPAVAQDLIFRNKAITYKPESVIIAEKSNIAPENVQESEDNELSPVENPENEDGKQQEEQDNDESSTVDEEVDYSRDELLAMADECDIVVEENMSDAEIQAAIKRHLAEKG